MPYWFLYWFFQTLPKPSKKPENEIATKTKEKALILTDNQLKSRLFSWSCWADSNCRPHPYQGCALPTELQQRVATTKGLEPSTSGVTGRRSNQLNYMAVYARCRVISTQQIDYSTYNVCCKEFFLAGAERFELSTRGFGDRCSTS